MSKKSRSAATPLNRLARHKKTLRSPLKQLPGLYFSSWINDVLPDALWSVLLAGLLPREKALAAFRTVLTIYKKSASALAPTQLVHSQLALLDSTNFKLLFEPICADSEIRDALRPLLLIESLPDNKNWRQVISDQPEFSDGMESLARAVVRCFDHQSQASTDCRWLKVMVMLAQDKIVFPSNFSEHVEELIHYPNRGDMRAVRPSIRSMEMAFRNPALQKDTPLQKDIPPPWAEVFWDECWKRTQCFPSHSDEDAKLNNHGELFESVATLYDEVSDHFARTVKTTSIDARHDASFGLVLYLLQMLVFALKGTTGQSTASRLLLRAAFETYVSFLYSAKKDDPTIWMQYRNHGSGQQKLAYLKISSAKETPSFISLELLEQLSNEDMWLEFQDINLGAWSEKNLRMMASEVGVKDLYDAYYDSLSGFAHSSWAAVRQSAFGVCLNPLHRFHRVPLPPRWLNESVVPDIVKFVNLSLDQLASLYPPFKTRLSLAHKKQTPESEGE